MASSDKTSRLALNQWAADDPFLREDFNADNRKLDAAFAALGDTRCADGNYTGTSAPQKITLGFRPKLVLISGFRRMMDYNFQFWGMMDAKYVTFLYTSSSGVLTPTITVNPATSAYGPVDGGFYADNMLNYEQASYHYVAFG